jgi:hypothetical protein
MEAPDLAILEKLLPVTVIVKIIVTGVSEMNSETGSRREKYLFRSIAPNLQSDYMHL